MTSLELLICAFLVSVSAFMSSSEIALFSLSRFQLRAMKEHLRPALHKQIKKLLSDPGGLLITILVMNEIVNISLSAVVTRIIARNHVADWGLFKVLPGLSSIPAWALEMAVGTLLTTPVVLIICEASPKVIAARANQLIASLAASPMSVIYTALSPVRAVLNRLISAIARWTSPKGVPTMAHDGKAPVLKESDFLFMLEEGNKEGAIHDSELGLIRKVFDLDDTTVEEVYKPLSQTMTISSQTTLKNALGAFRGQKYSRIPVVAPSKKVVGILYSKDLLRAKLDPELLNLSVTAVMRKPFFVQPKLRLNSLFRRLKQERTHMAVVQAPTGESIGVVTMNGVLEALFEDLLTEEDYFHRPRALTPATATEREES